MTRRKVCVVTTSRADFGLLRGVMRAIQEDKSLRLQAIASGMHLMKSFGSTWRDIEAEGIRIDKKIDMRLRGGSNSDSLKSISAGITGFAEALSELKPEIVVLLGDRFELLAAAIPAMMLSIPIAHIHGGELSEGAVDDSVRHALTKMGSLHFPATETYRRRIIQMGESPRRVYNFGAPGLDAVHNSKLMSKSELEHDLGVDLGQPAALVTFHPATRDLEDTEHKVRALLRAIKASGLTAIFTMANADAQGALINKMLKEACARNPAKFKWLPHLGHRRYLSCLRFASLMIGNSSSGLTEAPSFRLPVINIGDRQKGRVRAANVIDVPCEEPAIRKGIRKALSAKFRNSLRGMRNPYDRFHDGRVSERIKDVLRDVILSDDLIKKEFYDMA